MTSGSSTNESRSRPAVRVLQIAKESRYQCLWLAESEQVPARELFDLQPETVFSYASLKLEGKEPIIAARQNTGRDVRPVIERKRRREERVSGSFIAGPRQCRKHLGGQVM
jgi:hypothetical protein